MKKAFILITRVFALTGLAFLIRSNFLFMFKVDLVDVISGRMRYISEIKLDDKMFKIVMWHETGFDYCVAIESQSNEGLVKCALVDADHHFISNITWRISRGVLSADTAELKNILQIQLNETILSNHNGRGLAWRDGSVRQLRF